MILHHNCRRRHHYQGLLLLLIAIILSASTLIPAAAAAASAVAAVESSNSVSHPNDSGIKKRKKNDGGGGGSFLAHTLEGLGLRKKRRRLDDQQQQQQQRHSTGEDGGHHRRQSSGGVKRQSAVRRLLNKALRRSKKKMEMPGVQRGSYISNTELQRQTLPGKQASHAAAAAATTTRNSLGNLVERKSLMPSTHAGSSNQFTSYHGWVDNIDATGLWLRCTKSRCEIVCAIEGYTTTYVARMRDQAPFETTIPHDELERYSSSSSSTTIGSNGKDRLSNQMQGIDEMDGGLQTTFASRFRSLGSSKSKRKKDGKVGEYHKLIEIETVMGASTEEETELVHSLLNKIYFEDYTNEVILTRSWNLLQPAVNMAFTKLPMVLPIHNSKVLSDDDEVGVKSTKGDARIIPINMKIIGEYYGNSAYSRVHMTIAKERRSFPFVSKDNNPNDKLTVGITVYDLDTGRKRCNAEITRWSPSSADEIPLEFMVNDEGSYFPNPEQTTVSLYMYERSGGDHTNAAAAAAGVALGAPTILFTLPLFCHPRKTGYTSDIALFPLHSYKRPQMYKLTTSRSATPERRQYRYVYLTGMNTRLRIIEPIRRPGGEGGGGGSDGLNTGTTTTKTCEYLLYPTLSDRKFKDGSVLQMSKLLEKSEDDACDGLPIMTFRSHSGRLSIKDDADIKLMPLIDQQHEWISSALFSGRIDSHRSITYDVTTGRVKITPCPINGDNNDAQDYVPTTQVYHFKDIYQKRRSSKDNSIEVDTSMVMLSYKWNDPACGCMILDMLPKDPLPSKLPTHIISVLQRVITINLSVAAH